MKKLKDGDWAALLEDELSKDTFAPDYALTCSEFIRQSGLSRARGEVLLKKLVKEGKVKAVKGRTFLNDGRSIRTTCYVMKG